MSACNARTGPKPGRGGRLQIHIDNGFDINDDRHKRSCVTCRAIAQKLNATAKVAEFQLGDKVKAAFCMRCRAEIAFEEMFCEDCHQAVNIR